MGHDANPDDPTGRDQLSRRAAIRRLAVGAGVVWAAPVVMSVGSSAAAASAPFTGNCGTKFVCSSGIDATCGPEDADCLCVDTTDGVLFCAANFACRTALTCTTSADCPAGWRCQAAGSGCCGFGVCLPPCGTPDPERAFDTLRPSADPPGPSADPPGLTPTNSDRTNRGWSPSRLKD
jgi:hypothetical protein